MESPQQILPPPPTKIPPNIVPIKIEPAKHPSSFERVKPQIFAPVIRPNPGSKGKRVSLLTNHFKVTTANAISDFYHYNVSICYEDGLEVTRKNIKMAVIEKLCELYKSELDRKTLVYDSVRSLFAHGPLPQNNLEFSVVLNPVSAKGINGSQNGSDQKRQRIASRSAIFKVQIKFVSKISMQLLNDYSSLRVLNTILQQQASKQGCLVVRQSFFQNEPSNFIDLGGGILGCRGFFSSFKALQGGLYLNHDVSMTTIIQPGPVVDFLLSNQNVKTPFKINWTEASRTLKNLRMMVKHLHSEFKITGLSERSCKEQKFSLKLGEASGGNLTIETTIYDYFVRTRGIELSFSANLPCINVGKPSHPIFFPIELCFLVPLQRCKKELTGYQKSAMITKSRQKPEDLIKTLAEVVKRIKPKDEPLLQSCGISINSSFVQAEGRILSAPRLKMGKGEHIIPRNGWWSIKDKVISPPLCVFEENPKHKKKPASVRVEMMFAQIKSKFRQNPPQFILCLLADKKFSDLYGPWKRKTIVEFGIRDQCISSNKIDEHYLMNVLLKINAKLGGFNHTVDSEITRTIPLVSKVPTMILGMEVSHASPGRTNAPSIASKDAGIIRELLLEFYASSGQKKPAQIVIFRNGLSTSQFDQILTVEMHQIVKACNFLEENWRPKITVIVSQRRHHTKFFDPNSGANVLPGTIVDNKVCDLECTNFYVCAHAARMGTLRPTHYHVLLDEIGFSSDDLQELIHSLSYFFQRSNNAISEVAPVRYARLAAAKISQIIAHDKILNTGYQLPKVHKNVSSSMFFI
ncbi:hypothetical protein DH2020_042669 [Rehmannia glutinosa]|uniref:Uncharacterized protein n=1 Tax=Rehmannia glutinosa TaxID=99300 RepID=A0ABR0UN60_REHGL